MKSFARLENVILLSSLSLLSFLARALLDWRYVFPILMNVTVESAAISTFIYALIIAVWIWALANLSRPSNAAWIILVLLNVFQFLLVGLFTTLALCPTPCPSVWPVGEIVIWSSTVTGLLGFISLIMFRRRRQSF